MDFQSCVNSTDCTLVRHIRRKQGAQISLMRRASGELFVLRCYDHPVPAYGLLLENPQPALPTVFRYELLEDGATVVEEDYIDGISLSELLQTCSPDARQTAAITDQLCQALSHLHQLGLVHRDVKPENILLTGKGRVVLLDLDAASKVSGNSQRDTQLLGTVGYAAPEQFGLSRSDARSDIFSLGVLMNVMRIGQHPSQALAPAPLRSLIETCLQVNAGKRFSTVRALQRQLPPVRAAAPCPKCGFVTPGGGCLYCGEPSRPPKRPGLWLAAAAGLLLLGLLVLPKKPAPPVAPTPPEPIVETLQDTEPEPIPEEEKPALLRRVSAPVCTWEQPDDADPFAFLASFSHDGETYYLGPAYWDGPGTQPHTDHGFTLTETDFHVVTWSACFWTRQENGNWILVEDARQRELEAAFDSLSIRLLARTEGQTPPLLAEPYRECPLSANLTTRLDSSCAGGWLVEVSGSLDGDPIRSLVPVSVEILPTLTFSPDPGSETDVITQVNQWLAQQDASSQGMFEILLPAGTFSGLITIPEAEYSVTISGATEAGQLLTVLEGGVHSSNLSCHLQDLSLRGCGKDQPFRPDGTPNQGFYGPGGGTHSNCTFSDYACAVHCSHRLRFAGSGSSFLGNGIGICMDTNRNSGGSFTLEGCVFEDNEIAVDLRRISDWLPPSHYAIVNCTFSGNRVHIQNALPGEPRLAGNTVK